MTTPRTVSPERRTLDLVWDRECSTSNSSIPTPTLVPAHELVVSSWSTNLHGYDVHTGEPRWVHAGSYLMSAIAVGHALVVYEQSYDTGHRLVWLDPATGAALGELAPACPSRTSVLGPVVVGGRIVWIERGDRGAPSSICTADAARPELIARQEIATTWTLTEYVVPCGDGVVINAYRSDDKREALLRLDVATGAIVWQHEGHSFVRFATPACVLVQDREAGHSLDAATGAVRWQGEMIDVHQVPVDPTRCVEVRRRRGPTRVTVRDQLTGAVLDDASVKLSRRKALATLAQLRVEAGVLWMHNDGEPITGVSLDFATEWTAEDAGTTAKPIAIGNGMIVALETVKFGPSRLLGYQAPV